MPKDAACESRSVCRDELSDSKHMVDAPFSRGSTLETPRARWRDAGARHRESPPGKKPATCYGMAPWFDSVHTSRAS